jgi:Uma2 family endonuclease
MATEVSPATIRLADGVFEWDPAWDDVRDFPIRIPCTEEEYLAIDANLLLEYADGFLEVLPMPTIFHQLILKFLCWELDAFVAPRRLGTVVFAAYKVRIRSGKYREPDILFIKSEHKSGIGKDWCTKADLVIEIVSESNRRHDLGTKREEYARAAIPEYWIIDPEEGTITVLTLKRREKRYVEHGTFHKGERATSKLLAGFGVDVTTALTQRPEIPR